MKYIEVSKNSKRGKKTVAWVDDIDFELLNMYNWSLSGGGYACRIEVVDGKKKTIFMHKEILRKEGFYTDHADGDKLNNQRHNLRIATNQQNLYNQKKSKNKKLSKYKGVSFCAKKKVRKWKAYIVPDRKLVFLGYYDTEDEAGIAYNEKATELWGDMACLNVIDNVKKKN